MFLLLACHLSFASYYDRILYVKHPVLDTYLPLACVSRPMDTGTKAVMRWLKGATDFTRARYTPVLVVPPWVLTPNRFYVFRVQVTAYHYCLSLSISLTLSFSVSMCILYSQNTPCCWYRPGCSLQTASTYSAHMYLVTSIIFLVLPLFLSVYLYLSISLTHPLSVCICGHSASLYVFQFLSILVFLIHSSSCLYALYFV